MWPTLVSQSVSQSVGCWMQSDAIGVYVCVSVCLCRWQVDLGKDYPVGKIIVYNRYDCCDNR